MLFETIQTRINARITRLVSTLIYSRWASDYSEHCGTYKVSDVACIGLPDQATRNIGRCHQRLGEDRLNLAPVCK